MKTAPLVLALAALLPAQLSAQRFDYHLLLDSAMPAARAALLAAGHRANASEQRPDGFTQQTYTATLPDSAGAPTTTEMTVVLIGRADRITRVVLRASSNGPDTAAVKSASQYFVRRLTEVYGRPMNAGEETGWCWMTRQRAVDLTLDRVSGEVSLIVGYAPN